MDFMKIKKKQLFMEAQYSPGALSPLHKSFLILGNAARCAPLKIPQISYKDDIRVLFFHLVLSTVECLQFLESDLCTRMYA